jgi:hypothetical protein
MHEEAFTVIVGNGQEAGCLARGDLLHQAGTRPERRYRPPVQLRQVRSEILLDVLGKAVQIAELVRADPGGVQDGNDLLVCGLPVRRRRAG